MNYKEIICDANNLYTAYLASVKTSKWKETTQRFSLNYLREIFSLQDDLLNQTYRPSKEDTFRLKERGKERQITSLKPRDRVVRHVLCDEILMPKVKRHIIYDNCASVTGRGISMQRKRFEVHLHKYFMEYGTNKGYILLGDYSKFYDNVIHDIAKTDFLSLCDNDPYIEWLLNVIFENFRVDVSYMSSDEFDDYKSIIFNKMDYIDMLDDLNLTGDKFMDKSVNIGDQISQVVGIYYPHVVDNYVKTVRAHKYYGRYMDDFYILHPSKRVLEDTLKAIDELSASRGMHINYDKTRIVRMDSTYKFLQFKYTLTDSGKIISQMNPKRIIDMRRKLRKLHRKSQNGSVSKDSIEDLFRSYMGAYGKTMSKISRQNMINLYSDLFEKSVEFKNGKYVIF